MIVRRALLPVIGVNDIILPAFDETLGTHAIRAQEGDIDARDALFFAFLPKLDRLMANVRPPYAPGGMTGVWDRDDIEQEAYLVFVELLHAWSGDVSFTAWLLSRFPWRLKDSIRDGIGKSPVPPRFIHVPLEVADQCPVLLRDLGPDNRDAVDALMEAMPPHLAQVLVARALLGKTMTEIGREMGLSRRTMVRYWQEIRRYAFETLGDPR